MTSYDLNRLLSGHAFGFVMLLSRIGGVIMLFPGIGESYVPPRTRLILAAVISLLLLEPMVPRLPPLPEAPADLARLIGYEILIGVFFGTLVRLVLTTLDAAGMIIGLQTGLSNAVLINPTLATQSPLPSAFLSVIGLALIFISGMDHFLIRSMVALYDAFPPGGEWMTGDMAQTVIHTANRSFITGIELAAPFTILGLLFYTALGIVQRLLPTIQVFLISVPLEIAGGLAVLSVTVAGIMTMWLQFFDQQVANFFAP